MEMGLFQLGAGDCETIGDGTLVQPINAVTSLSYSIVGVVLIALALSHEGERRRITITFGSLLVLTGLGSFLYHGPQTPFAHFAHDVSFLAAIWFLALLNLIGASLLSRRGFGLAFTLALVLLAAALLIWPQSTNAHTAIAIAVLVISDVVRRRSAGFSRGWHTAALVTFVVSLIVNAMGRTGAPTCDPGSVLQLHGLWHVLSSVALGAYFVAALPTSGKGS